VFDYILFIFIILYKPTWTSHLQFRNSLDLRASVIGELGKETRYNFGEQAKFYL